LRFFFPCQRRFHPGDLSPFDACWPLSCCSSFTPQRPVLYFYWACLAPKKLPLGLCIFSPKAPIRTWSEQCFYTRHPMLPLTRPFRVTPLFPPPRLTVSWFLLHRPACFLEIFSGCVFMPCSFLSVFFVSPTPDGVGHTCFAGAFSFRTTPPWRNRCSQNFFRFKRQRLAGPLLYSSRAIVFFETTNGRPFR